MRVVLSRSAAADLDTIDDYTIQHFCLQQAIRTTEAFMRTFQQLSDLPYSAPIASEISPPGRPLRCRTVLGSFIVVYEPFEDGIRVARVLHGARHLLSELERDSGEKD